MKTMTAQLIDLRLLEANYRENQRYLKTATVPPPDNPVVCKRCGFFELLMFWTPLYAEDDCVRLACPSCGNTKASYRLEGSAERAGQKMVARDPSTWVIPALVGAAVAVLLVVGGVRGALQDKLSATWEGRSQYYTSISGDDWAITGNPRAADPRSRDGQIWGIAALDLFRSENTQTEQVILAEGDRVETIRAYVRDQPDLRAASSVSPIRALNYLQDLDVTRLVVDARSRVWAEHSEAIVNLMDGGLTVGELQEIVERNAP